MDCVQQEGEKCGYHALANSARALGKTLPGFPDQKSWKSNGLSEDDLAALMNKLDFVSYIPSPISLTSEDPMFKRVDYERFRTTGHAFIVNTLTRRPVLGGTGVGHYISVVLKPGFESIEIFDSLMSAKLREHMKSYWIAKAIRQMIWESTVTLRGLGEWNDTATSVFMDAGEDLDHPMWNDLFLPPVGSACTRFCSVRDEPPVRGSPSPSLFPTMTTYDDRIVSKHGFGVLKHGLTLQILKEIRKLIGSQGRERVISGNVTEWLLFVLGEVCFDITTVLGTTYDWMARARS